MFLVSGHELSESLAGLGEIQGGQAPGGWTS